MSDSSWALQVALYDILTDALSVQVYDQPSGDAAYPYVTVGESTVVDDSTKTASGQEHTVTIHAWDQGGGRQSVKEILAQVYDALHRKSIPVAGHNLVLCHFDFASTVALDIDDKTYHGVHRYRIVMS